MATAQDWFGANYVGLDPYGSAKADKLSRYSMLDSLLSARQQAQQGDRSQVMPGAGRAPRASSSAPTNLSQYYMTRGTGGLYSPAITGDVGDPGGDGGNTGGGTTDTVPTTSQPTITGDTGGTNNDGGGNDSGGTYGGTPLNINQSFGPQIPEDLGPLRQMLGDFFMGNLGRTFPQYNGLLDVQPSLSAQTSHNFAAGLPTDIRSFIDRGMPTVNNLMGFNTSADLSNLYGPLSQVLSGQNPNAVSSLYGVAQRGMGDVGNWLNQAGSAYGSSISAASGLPGAGAGFLNSALANYGDLAATGGGVGGLNQAVSDIYSKGRLDLNDTLAQIKEQYGAMGLGAGSDIAEALARGAGSAYAGMARDASGLTAQLMDSAQGRRLSAVGMAPSLTAGSLSPLQAYIQAMQGGGAGYGQLGATQAGATAGIGSVFGQAGGLESDALNRIVSGLGIGSNMAQINPNLAIQSAGIQGSGVGLLNNFASTFGQNQLGAAGVLLGLGQYDSSLQEGNIGRNWQAWQQAQMPMFLDQATSYATGFAPALQKPVVGGNGGVSGIGGMLGGIAGGLGGLLTGIAMLSHSSLKEDIQPIDGEEMLRRLETIDVYRWKYKKGIDAVQEPHIGPMAEDWKHALDIGDGRTIHAVDAIGILVSAVKTLSARVKELENAKAR